jgi:hypothetical protein
MSDEKVIEAGLNAGRMTERADLVTIILGELNKTATEMTMPLDDRQLGRIDGLMFIVKLLTDRSSR